MDYETRKLKTAEKVKAGPTLEDLLALEKMNQVREGWKAETTNRRRGCLGKLLFLMALVIIVWAGSKPVPMVIVPPTEIPTQEPGWVAATSLQVQPTPTLAPTVTPSATTTATATGTNTAVPTTTPYPSSTPLPTYTALPTYTVPPTETAVPPTPTRPIALVMVVPTAAPPITHAINELEDTKQSLMLVGSVTSSLFLLSLGTLVWAARGLRRPRVLVPTTAEIHPPALPRRLPPPTWQPKRETRIVPNNQLVEPVQPVQPVPQPVATGGGEVAIQLPFDKRQSLTPSQRAYVRTVYLRHLEATKGRGGVNRTALELWGYKDDIICNHIEDALEEGGIPYPSKLPPQQRPIIITSTLHKGVQG